MAGMLLREICWAWHRRAGLALAGSALIIACGGSAATPAESPAAATGVPFVRTRRHKRLEPGCGHDLLESPVANSAGIRAISSGHSNRNSS